MRANLNGECGSTVLAGRRAKAEDGSCIQSVNPYDACEPTTLFTADDVPDME